MVYEKLKLLKFWYATRVPDESNNAGSLAFDVPETPCRLTLIAEAELFVTVSGTRPDTPALTLAVADVLLGVRVIPAVGGVVDIVALVLATTP